MSAVALHSARPTPHAETSAQTMLVCAADPIGATMIDYAHRIGLPDAVHVAATLPAALRHYRLWPADLVIHDTALPDPAGALEQSRRANTTLIRLTLSEQATPGHRLLRLLVRSLTTPPPTAIRRAPTDRELSVLRGMAAGHSNNQIGHDLHITEDTVKTHARRLYHKLGAHDRAEAVARGFRTGLLR